MSARRLVLLLLLGACLPSCAGSTVKEASGDTSGTTGVRRGQRLDQEGTLRVRADLRLADGTYLRGPVGEGGRDGVIRIEGVSEVTLDLGGATLRGMPDGEDLDRASGYGIVISDSSRVTVRNGKLCGYKGCIVVENSREVLIEDVEFDGWFGQHLLSSPAAEDLSDWLWPHDNDRGEWLAKYGGAISVTDCSAVTVRRCKGRHGQNGILLTRANECEVYDSDFSFLSGWGLAMYRSSRNAVSHNLFDYCVRGYSHGVYWRGQDSAGILMFERCSDNVVAFNSATHGGDGIFLFGGQDVVEGRAYERGETEVGGSDDNLFYGNDLSYAVANSLEATFSTGNRAIGNRMVGSHQHGIWGGYSTAMLIADNEIADTLGGGIAIEHGQDCVMVRNEIRGNEQGIRLWWDLDESFVNGPFGKHHDTASRDHWIVDNLFADNVQDLVFDRTTDLVMRGNTFESTGSALFVNGLRRAGVAGEGEDVRALLTGVDGSRPSGRVDDSTLAGAGTEEPALLATFAAFVPPDVPGSLEVSAAASHERQGLETIVMGEWGPWDYRSGEPRPEPRKPGGLLADAAWDAAWFAWHADTDPRGDLAVWRALKYEPLARATVDAWTDPWGSDEVRRAVGDTYFGLIARADVTIDEDGLYRLTVRSDDGVRVTIDDVVTIEDWTWHAPRRAEKEIELTRGTHVFELEYFQIDGATALTLDLERVVGE